MDSADTRLCLLLHGIEGLDDPGLARLLLHCGSPAAAAAAGPDTCAALQLPPQTGQSLQQAVRRGRSERFDTDAQQRALDATAARIVPICHSAYPPLLRAIHDPPPLLYIRGDPAALCQAQLGIVGSRRASSAGLRLAQSLAGEAVAAGLVVSSGLARGVDGAAHRGALEAGGQSVAVVATGIDRVYPACHRKLAGELEQAGCLVSEFPPGTPPRKENFPRRNRLISGLSLGVLVVEAALRSGSLITARTAMEQGREVFALPWSVLHATGGGCLQLLRDGVKMVAGLEDVLEELAPMYAVQQDLFPRSDPVSPQEIPELPAARSHLLALLGYEATSVDDLARVAALPARQLLAELSELEMEGLVSRTPGGYIRC